MPLLKFRKKQDPDLSSQESDIETRAREAIAESMAEARAMMATKEFKALKEDLAQSSTLAIDLLIQIDKSELDPIRFSARVRELLSKIKFLREIEVLVERKAGQDGR